ncbi:MAG: AMP-binding protein [Clostridiales bacterium]|nr:AMP-binding protein [Clostridiales bacterium]
MNKEEYRNLFEKDFLWINGFMRNVKRFPQKCALQQAETGKAWTYEELNKEANRMANSMATGGFKKEDCIMYALYNSPQFIICHLAAHKLSGVSTPINYNWAPQEIAYVMEDSKPKVFVYDSEIAHLVAQALELSSYKPETVLYVEQENLDSFSEGDSAGGEEVPGQRMELYMVAGGDSEPERQESSTYDETVRLYTSGTTGRPKGVPLSDLNEILSAHDVAMHFPLNETDTTLNMTPWFHRGGLHSGGPTPSLYVGAKVVSMRKFNPKFCSDYMEEYGVSFLIGAPSVLKFLSRQQKRSPRNFATLKGIITMGSPLEKADCIEFMDVLTPNLFNGYGTTETFWNTFLRPWQLPEMSGSAGRSCIFDDVYVVKAYEDRKAEPDELVSMDGKEVGEVIIKSSGKMSYSYHNNPAAEEKKYYKGYLYTGDLATWDEECFITIAGRKDDMIICSGENIYPVQIEEAFMEHPAVKDIIVSGVADEIRGQAVVAYIIPEGEPPKVSELIDFASEHRDLSTFKRPRFYRFVEELPYTATGKKMHYKVKQMAEEDKKKGILLR